MPSHHGAKKKGLISTRQQVHVSLDWTHAVSNQIKPQTVKMRLRGLSRRPFRPPTSCPLTDLGNEGARCRFLPPAARGVWQDIEAERGMCIGVVGIAVAGAEVAGLAEALAVEREVGGSDDPRSIFNTGASSGRHCQGGARWSLYRASFLYIEKRGLMAGYNPIVSIQNQSKCAAFIPFWSKILGEDNNPSTFVRNHLANIPITPVRPQSSWSTRHNDLQRKCGFWHSSNYKCYHH